MTAPFFTQKSPSEERAMLLGDDALCTQTKIYLAPLINAALARQKISTEETRRLSDEILSDVPIARERFFSNARNITENTKFSVYFTWYIAQRINGRGGTFGTLIKKIGAIFQRPLS
jgi:hypothetical protein